MKLAPLACALLLAAACGSKSKSPDTAGGGNGGDNPGAEPAAWTSLEGPQRAEYMKNVVKPAMAAVFQGHDAEEFSEFGCKTCHGSGVDLGQFDMPSPELPALSMEEIMNPDADHQAITDFMKNQVVPEMAKLLGTTPYDPATNQGFGCFGCHPMEQ